MAKRKNEEKETDMSAPEQKQNEVTETNVKVLDVQTIKQPQTILDLDTMEDVKIVIVYDIITVNDKAVARDSKGEIVADTKTFTGKLVWSAAPEEDQLREAEALVQPMAEQINALLKYATAQAYQVGKRNAYASVKNPFTPELKKKTVELLGQTAAYSESSNKDIGERLMSALAAKHPEALKWVDRARMILEAGQNVGF